VLTPTDTSDPWPFTVRRVALRCELQGDLGRVVVRANGKDYGVNGTALARYPRVDPIWKSAGNGLKVNISEVLELGLAMCEPAR